MVFVVALLVWFALSVPATLVLGRVLANARRGTAVPAPVGSLLPSHQDLVRR
jgi:hypothetical protein